MERELGHFSFYNTWTLVKRALLVHGRKTVGGVMEIGRRWHVQYYTVFNMELHMLWNV